MTQYKFTLPADFVQVLYQALGELPLKISGPVFSIIDAQKREQDKESAETPK